MPTYDYQCTACSHRFEQFQSMKDKPLRKCPKCGKNALERLIGTGAAVIFKGGGFYQTDYRSESYKKAAEAESKPADSKAADSKPAADPSAPTVKPDAAPDKAKKADPKKPAADKPKPAKSKPE